MCLQGTECKWWDEAAPAEGICLDAQLPELQPPASSSTMNRAGLDLSLI